MVQESPLHWVDVVNGGPVEKLNFYTSILLFPEPAITGKAVVPCCRSNGCHRRLSWRESSLARLIPGINPEHIIQRAVYTVQ